MFVKQISIFLENKSGRLSEVTKTLGENNIDISALSIADTTDFGILRLIVNNPEKAEQILKAEGFTVSATSVIAIGVQDKPGGLAKALDVLDKEQIGIEYMYAFVSKSEDEALVILKVAEPEKAVDTLQANGISVLSSSQVYKL
ncbi:MAG TPA: ACT domain-containing protein [Clostridia bacterium]|nr:ACT domain-containing protein [Clostridia bacterium]